MAFLRNHIGEIEDVPEQDVEFMRQRGWVDASLDEVSSYTGELERRAKEERYGTIGETVKAGAEGVARGLTFGASDWVENKLLDNGAEIRAREEAHPVLSFAGEALGMVAPAVFTGGTTAAGRAGAEGALVAAEGASIAAKATRAYDAIKSALALTPAGIGNAASKAVAEGALKVLPETSGLLGRVLERAGAEALGSAPVGALMAVGHGLHENAIGNPKYTAEALLSASGKTTIADDVGEYLIYGGALSGLIGGGTELGSAIVRRGAKAGSEAFEQAWGKFKRSYAEAAEFHGTSQENARLLIERRREVVGLADAIPGIERDLETANPKTLEYILDNADRIAKIEKSFPGLKDALRGVEPGTAAEVVDNWHMVFRDPNAFNRVATAQADAMQALVDQAEEASRIASVKLRPLESEELIRQQISANPHYGWKGTEKAGKRAVKAFDSSIGMMRAEPELYDAGVIRRMELIRDSLSESLSKASPEEAFAAIDKAKKTIDSKLAKWEKKPNGPSEDAIEAARDLRGQLKDLLESAKSWGDAGSRQAAYNEALSEYFDARKVFLKKFGSKSIVRGREVYTVEPTKVETWFRTMSKSKGEFSTDIVNTFIDASNKLAEQIEITNGTLKGSTRAEFSDLANAIKTAREVTADSVERGRVTGKVAQIAPQALNSNIVVPTQAALTAQMLGSAAGRIPVVGPVIETVKTVYDSTKSVATTARRIVAIEDMAEAVFSREGVLATLAKNNEALSRGIAGDIARAIASPARLALAAKNPAVEAIAQRDRTAEDRARDFERKAQALRKAANPQVMLARATALSEKWGEHAPNTAMAAAATAARGVQFLASKLPQAPDADPADLISGEPQWAASPAQIERFNRYSAAVTNPRSILESLRNGSLTAEEVEAVRTVYPTLFQEMQKSALEALQKNRGRVPREIRNSFDLLMDAPPSKRSVAVQATFGEASKPQASAPGGGTKKGPEGAAKRLSLRGHQDS